ncbi:hypothetical protein GGS23DRAFT_613954 [Durotheca rogersii]|uniref:uncharacterized protein n=1 Tax=Durotheca rogersii TaxID=419775 RepID=UPI0022204828|nr:uncharacterized protein GGS23DRAFT_613954 [Durotheca rogersii]KAI5860395.1 hypothetical protein GGS23DRAFT_613954 [Durotheca rogersii]
MRAVNIAFLTSVLAGATTASWKHADEDEFRQVISGPKPALVAFVEPSTATCQAFEAEWTLAAESEKALVSINCASTASLCHEFGVISYPAVRFFDGQGKMTPYRGPRRARSILAYLRRAARPEAVAALASEAEIAAFQTSDDFVVVARVRPQDAHVGAAYAALAAQYRDRLSFGRAEAAPSSSSSSSVACYNNRDGQQFGVADLAAADALQRLVDSCLAPLVGEFTRANEMQYLQSGKIIAFYFAASARERDAFADAVRPVAKLYKEYLSVVTVEAGEYGELAAPLGLGGAPALPALSFQHPMTGQVFPYPRGRPIAPDDVGAFFADIAQGRVPPWDGTPPAEVAGTEEEEEAAGGAGSEDAHDEL